MNVGKVAVALGFFVIVGVSVYALPKEQEPGPPNCKAGESSRFFCYASHYSDLTQTFGADVAIGVLKENVHTDLYSKKECHFLMHTIGRTAGEHATSLGVAFSEGDQYCAGGYYHGVMEWFLQKPEAEELDARTINGVCEVFRTDALELSPAYQDCSHGLGHGIMVRNNNKLFEALNICDLLEEPLEREFCYGGVFMENTLTDFREHTTAFLKEDDLTYPCSAVDDHYKQACYAYQSSYIFKITQDFETIFNECELLEEEYQQTCFQGVGRIATGDFSYLDYEYTKESCLTGSSFEAQSNCVIGAAVYFMANHQKVDDGKGFCEVLEGTLEIVCNDVVTRYSDILTP